jgi:acetyl-CoA carboxylase biotin carboxyl carrier protein
MPTYNLVAKVYTEGSGQETTHLVRAPAVGVADGVPDQGVYLNPLEAFLTLRILDRRYTVRLPRNVQGRVVEQFIEDTSTPVEYKQPLLRLGLAESSLAGVAEVGGGATADSGADADLIPVPAPSEGVFYRRPGPDSPAYVEQGAEVSAGATLGLVEVMKSFNQITYGGPALPERGVVVKILVEDTAEVSFGQPLFLIRPA